MKTWLKYADSAKKVSGLVKGDVAVGMARQAVGEQV